MESVRRIYQIIGWALVALGVAHLVFGLVTFGASDLRALWFASGGLMVIYLGALNLLNVRYSRAAPALVPVCIASNVASSALAALLVKAAGAGIRSSPQLLVALLLTLSALVLSAARRKKG